MLKVDEMLMWSTIGAYSERVSFAVFKGLVINYLFIATGTEQRLKSSLSIGSNSVEAGFTNTLSDKKMSLQNLSTELSSLSMGSNSTQEGLYDNRKGSLGLVIVNQFSQQHDHEPK